MHKPSARVDFERVSPARFTTAEFLAMCAAGAFKAMKVELVDGEIYRISPPLVPHSFYQSRIIILLNSVVAPETGMTVLAETGITLREGAVRACDAAMVQMSDERGMLRADDVVLLVEIADTSLDEDLGRKMRDYAEASIPNYWVVDVDGRVVHVMGEPVDGRFEKRDVVRFGEPLAVPGGNQTVTIA